MEYESIRKRLLALPALGAIDSSSIRKSVLHFHFFISDQAISSAGLKTDRIVRSRVLGAELLISVRPYHWFVAEYDPDHDICFGFVHHGDWERGVWQSFGLEEVLSFRLGNIKVQFDKNWTPKTIVDLYKRERCYVEYADSSPIGAPAEAV